MHNRTLWRALAVGALAIAIATAIGIGAYNAGVTQGIAESGRALAAPPPGTPYVYMHRPWGFGFFPFFPILFFFLVAFLLRGLFWRGPWRGGWARCYNGVPYNGVPPAFDEWHRRAHGEPPTSAPAAGTPSGAP